eukprot:1180958-Prorocentrum_minimum.AAC.3
MLGSRFGFRFKKLFTSSAAPARTTRSTYLPRLARGGGATSALGAGTKDPNNSSNPNNAVRVPAAIGPGGGRHLSPRRRDHNPNNPNRAVHVPAAIGPGRGGTPPQKKGTPLGVVYRAQGLSPATCHPPPVTCQLARTRRARAGRPPGG